MNTQFIQFCGFWAELGYIGFFYNAAAFAGIVTIKDFFDYFHGGHGRVLLARMRAHRL